MLLIVLVNSSMDKGSYVVLCKVGPEIINVGPNLTSLSVASVVKIGCSR